MLLSVDYDGVDMGKAVVSTSMRGSDGRATCVIPFVWNAPLVPTNLAFLSSFAVHFPALRPHPKPFVGTVFGRQFERNQSLTGAR